MCLDITEKSRKMIAKNDKVVYKMAIMSMYDYVLDIVSDGISFKGCICGVQCSGKIHKDDKTLYFLTNEPYLKGVISPEMYGYLYSWKGINGISELIINGVDILDSKNIVKYLNENTNKEFLKTPYQRNPVKIGKTYKSDLIVNDNSIMKGLHSYKRKSSCGYFLSFAIVKCTIPKGTEYYVGLFGNKVSYASKKITYNEVVDFCK